MELRLFPIDIDYVVIEERPVIRIFGLTDKGEKKIVYDDSFRPYCYISATKDRIESAVKQFPFVKQIDEISKKRLGKDITVSRVFTALPEDVPKLKTLGMNTYDADIPFYKRYFLDHNIGTFTELKLDMDGDYVKEITDVSNGNPPLKAIAIDIETFSKKNFPDPREDPILAISIANYGVKKCITWLDAKGDSIERVADERALLKRFSEYVSESHAQVIIGYNSDSFDLPYINTRASVLGIKLLFQGFGIKVKEGKRKTSEINGLIHIDVLDFIRNIYAVYNLKTEMLTLDAVAQEMLGEKKKSFDWNKISEIFSNAELATNLCEYCAHDSYITYKIYEKLFPLLSELNRLIGQSLSDVSRMTTGAAVEHLIMKKAVEIGELIPNRPSEFEVGDRLRHVNEGAFVYQPKPGLYKDVSVFDFRSLYPSIIVSYNICPSTMVRTEGNISFLGKEKRQGLIPSILDNILVLRADAKKRMKVDDSPALKARVMVLKLIANGFYGYLGYYNARWYCFECAGAITRFGREYVHKVIDEAESHKFNVIYADTDSSFLAGESDSLKVDAFLKSINSKLPYPMELELQGIYLRAIFVSVKGSGHGAKKKYAMVDSNGNLIVKGFQSVRRDWSVIAKETQTTVLRKILIDDDVNAALNYVREIISNLKSGKVPLDKLVILTRLHKELSSYQQKGRHVSAASRSGVKFSSGDTIKYIIAKGKGKEPVSERALLYDIAVESGTKYDSEYYIKQQVLPSVSQIFSVLGFIDEDIVGEGQNSLNNFFV